ncbi:Non-specific phospholipase C6 [Abeliophyllum distichum]|uniref:Non-specific phospholipase C6 n=1 Tax=Abeliophyllum distichum TaxID=126358 RepID=A0ABD1QYA8_9LAMI
MLGWMKKYVNPSINAVSGKECNPVSTKTGDNETICFSDDAEYVNPDPGHSFVWFCRTSHVKKQLAKGYPQQTIFDSVHDSCLDFGIYFQNIPTMLFSRNLRKLNQFFFFFLSTQQEETSC